MAKNALQEGPVSRIPIHWKSVSKFVTDMFGTAFYFRLEPMIYAMADQLCPNYHGGQWNFFTLSNGGFLAVIKADPNKTFSIVSANGWSGDMSAEAFGITACMYAYSHLSMNEGAFAEICAEHYHMLRFYALNHPEHRAIFAACD